MDPDQALVAIFGSQTSVDTIYQSLCRSISSAGASPDVVIGLFAARAAAAQQQNASAEEVEDAEEPEDASEVAADV